MGERIKLAGMARQLFLLGELARRVKAGLIMRQSLRLL